MAESTRKEWSVKERNGHQKCRIRPKCLDQRKTAETVKISVCDDRGSAWRNRVNRMMDWLAAAHREGNPSACLH